MLFTHTPQGTKIPQARSESQVKFSKDELFECFGKNYSRDSYNILFFIACSFKGQGHVFTGVLGHFGHGHFGLGRFGLDISAMDVSATENVEGGRFGHNHKFCFLDVCMHKKVMHFISF